jgi:hypothetical protein
VEDTWTSRDLPVLDATLSLLEQSFMVTVTDIADRTGLEPAVVAAALEALDPSYVDFRKTTTGGDPRFWYVYKATPEARRVVGQWPTAEALATRLADELTAAAARETDVERQGLLTYAARLIGDTLRDATVRAAGHVLGPAFGGVPAPELGRPLPAPEPAAARQLRPLPEADLPINAAVTHQLGDPAEEPQDPEAKAEKPEQKADDPEETADRSSPSEPDEAAAS